jgi:hypothetical protein
MDIKLVLHYKSKISPACMLVKAINAAECAVFETELEDFEILRRSFPELHDNDLDSTRAELEATKGQTLQFDNAKSGPIALAGTVVQAAYLLLGKTIERTITDASKQMESHARLKQLCGGRRKAKAESIAAKINDVGETFTAITSM